MINVLGDRRESKYRPDLAASLNESAATESKTQAGNSVDPVSFTTPEKKQVAGNLPRGFNNDYLRSPHPADLSEYIILPGRQHEDYSYPDLLVSQGKMSGMGGLNWYESQMRLAKEGAIMLNPRQFVDFLNLLRTSPVFDGNGRKIEDETLHWILKKVERTRLNGSGEWLDIEFFEVTGGYFAKYDTRLNGDVLVPNSFGRIPDLAGIEEVPLDYESYLSTADKFGLPSENVARVASNSTGADAFKYWGPHCNRSSPVFMPTNETSPIRLQCMPSNYLYRGLSFRAAYVRGARTK